MASDRNKLSRENPFYESLPASRGNRSTQQQLRGRSARNNASLSGLPTEANDRNKLSRENPFYDSLTASRRNNASLGSNRDSDKADQLIAAGNGHLRRKEKQQAQYPPPQVGGQRFSTQRYPAPQRLGQPGYQGYGGQYSAHRAPHPARAHAPVVQEEQRREEECKPTKNSSHESKRNSLLVISGEKEIDISMPAAVRRSLTGEFVPKLNLSAATELVMIDNSTKPASSVDDAFLSDSEDEDIISGIFGKETLCPRQHKARKKSNRGFLDGC